MKTGQPHRRLSAAAALVVLLAIHVVMAMRGAQQKGAAFDEVAHISAGVSYWARGDFRLQPENGNWPQRLIGLGVLAGSPSLTALDQPAWRVSDAWNIGGGLLSPQVNDTAGVLFRARLPVALVSALLGILVFTWSRNVFGAAGGWVSVGLYAFSPTLLAHGALATSDLVAAAFFLAATAALWAVTQRVTPWTLAASVFSVAGLFLSKFSAPIIIPVAATLVGLRLAQQGALSVRLRGEAREFRKAGEKLRVFGVIALVHLLGTVSLIWASYGFRYRAMSSATAGERLWVEWTSVLGHGGWLEQLIGWIREWRLLPEGWIYGFSHVAFYAQHRVSFLNGTFSDVGGIPGFFAYAAVVKETIPALALIAVALVVVARDRRLLAEMSPVLTLVVVYLGFAMTSNLNIGHRHLLPAIPAFYVLAGAAGRAFESGARRRVLASLVAILLAWHAVEAMRVAPNFLAYFNPLDGGPKQAYRHLVDSSLDWGQDLPGLKAWLARNDDRRPVYLSYFGSVPPKTYGIEATHLPGYFEFQGRHDPEPLSGGTYVISATMLQGTYLDLPGTWTEKFEDQYQRSLQNMRVYGSTASDSAMRRALLRQTGDDFWRRNLHGFEQARFARLAAWLRKREPDDDIGYSILIYRLSDEQVREALEGPAPYSAAVARQ